jgi:hypothetical protein
MKLDVKFVVGAFALASAMPVAAATLIMERTALPQPTTEGSVTYVSGGIGKAESAAMIAEAKRYSLSLVFSDNKRNEYLADVHVTIQDRGGTDVLSTVSEGPIMLVKLPAGSYTVIAEAYGKGLRTRVRVTAAGEQRLDFHWPRV